MLAVTGDISAPANTFTIENGVFEVWYEFTTISDENPDNSTNSTTNSTNNATANGTDITNSTDSTNTTEPNSVNSTEATASATNITDGGSTNITSTTTTDNGTVTTDPVNGTNTTEPVNGTNTTEPVNGTNETNSTNTTTIPTHVVFVIKFNNPGEFFALGFGSSSMAGSDIWSFEFEEGVLVANDRKAFGFFEPPLDTARGGTSDVELLGYETTDTYTLVKVRRAMNTNDGNDAIIQPGENNIIWAFANSETIEYHQNNRGALTVTLAQ